MKETQQKQQNSERLKFLRLNQNYLILNQNYLRNKLLIYLVKLFCGFMANEVATSW